MNLSEQFHLGGRDREGWADDGFEEKRKKMCDRLRTRLPCSKETESDCQHVSRRWWWYVCVVGGKLKEVTLLQETIIIIIIIINVIINYYQYYYYYFYFSSQCISPFFLNF